MEEAPLVLVVSVDRILDLRWRILRAGLPMESACFPGDESGLHLAVISEERVIGCASFLLSTFEDHPAWQLRGMAVEPEFQRTGIGQRLLREAETILCRRSNIRQLWCNARLPAVPFYEKLGWTCTSDIFDIPTAGPHRRMTKILTT